jgi:hypothetical protein
MAYRPCYLGSLGINIQSYMFHCFLNHLITGHHSLCYCLAHTVFFPKIYDFLVFLFYAYLTAYCSCKLDELIFFSPACSVPRSRGMFLEGMVVALVSDLGSIHSTTTLLQELKQTICCG